MAYESVFSFKNIVKQIFPSFFAWNKNIEKLQIFDQNHGLTFLEKYQFLTILSCCFWSQKSRFSSLDYGKIHLTSLLCQNKKMEKLPTFHQTHGLTPLEKCQFFDFINFLFLLSTKVFSLSKISCNTFSRHFWAEIKIWKNCQFLTKTLD